MNSSRPIGHDLYQSVSVAQKMVMATIENTASGPVTNHA
jgi:hypothetical protein